MRDEDPDWFPSTTVGVRARLGPFPDLVLPLEPGLTALYGLNGAGKTWALEAIRRCWAGVGSDLGFVQLILDGPPGSALYDVVMTGIAERDPQLTLDREGQLALDRVVSDRGALALQLLLAWGWKKADPTAFGSRALVDAERSRYEAAAFELSESVTFAVVPVGGAEPAWEIWACTPSDWESLPRVADLIHELEGHAWPILRRFAECEFMPPLEELSAPLWELFEHPLAGWVRHQGVTSTNEWDYDLRAFSSSLWTFIRDGLPIPLARLLLVRGRARASAGRRLQEWLPRLHDERGDFDGDRTSAMRFHEEFAYAEAPGPMTITPEMRRWQGEMQDRVNTLYKSLLQDAPELMLAVENPTEWLVSQPMMWVTANGRRPLSALSTAQRRWAKFAVRWVLDAGSDVVLIDEPEASLHRSAEDHLARTLSGLGTPGRAVVVATHSPMLLDEADTQVVEIVRLGPTSSDEAGPRFDSPSDLLRFESGWGGFSVARPLGPVDRDSLERLGLQPSDLLRRYRAFVLVEGEHDRIILTTLLQDLLTEARAHVVAVRGASNLHSAADSEVLYHHTDAQLIAVLDRVHQDEIHKVWVDAQARYLADGPDLAVATLDHSLRGRGGGSEYQAIRDWLVAALRSGAPARFTPDGLRAPDILDYLPVEMFVPGLSSWQDLRDEHTGARASGQPVPKDFKIWLRDCHQADTSPERVRMAAEAVTEVPDDIRDLGYRIREIARRSAVRR